MSPLSMKIRMTMGPVEVEGELNDTGTARAIWEALPLSAPCGTWGGEIFFVIPVSQKLENAHETVEAGSICYYPPREAFCIFFGPTPASQGDEIRPSGPITVVGKIAGDPKVLYEVSPGTEVTIARAE